MVNKAQRDAAILEKYASGLGSPTIAKDLGVGKRTVLRVLTDNGVDTSNRNYTKTDVVAFEAEYRSGKSLSDIAKQHNVNAETVRYHLKKAGCLRSSADALCHFTTRGQEAEVIEMATVQKMSSYKIAEHFDVSPQVVQRFLKKRGISVGSFTPEWKEAMLRGLKSKQSRLEVTVAAMLDTHGIKYSTQFVLGDFKFDFLITDTNVLLEVQGSWWHSKPQRIQRDAFKRKLAAEAGYKLLVVWDYQITKPSFVINKIRHAISRPATLKLSDCTVSILPWKDAAHFIDQFHYQGRGRPGVTIGAYYGTQLAAVMVISSCVRLETEIKQGCITHELSRLVIDPQYQVANFGSWFIKRAIKLFKVVKPTVKRLVAFADPTFGHNGGIYMASNWTFDGVATASYWYYHRRKNEIYHKKSVWNNAKKSGSTESEFAEKHHLLKVIGQPKLRFICDL